MRKEMDGKKDRKRIGRGREKCITQAVTGKQTENEQQRFKKALEYKRRKRRKGKKTRAGPTESKKRAGVEKTKAEQKEAEKRGADGH